MKKVSELFLSAVLFLCLFFPSAVKAGDFSVGAGGGFSSSPYKGHDDSIMPFPLVFYEGERFFVRGLGAGVHIWKGDNQEISAGLSYSFFHFDPDSTDDDQLGRLDERYATATIDLLYRLRTQWGTASLKVSRDILGHSDGFTADASYRLPFSVGRVRLTPGVGVQWASQEQLDYYFGVSSRESQKSGLAEYSPSNAFSPYLSLDAGYSLTESWSLGAGAQVVFLNDEIKDSPMVDSSELLIMSVSAKYTF